jgi:ribosomal protein S27AE
MPARKKINLEKVLASLATPCPQCGYQIPPAEVRLVSSTQMLCPKCGVTFTASAPAGLP